MLQTLALTHNLTLKVFMIWLSIETSSPQTSLAYGKDNTCLNEVSSTQSASTCIEPLFRQLNITPSQIELCILGQGPGSYNGLRVGYGFLKGLLALNPLPVVQVPTPLILAALAAEKVKGDGTFLVINNARRGELYGALVEVKNHSPNLCWEQVSTTAELHTRTPPDLHACVTYDFSPEQLTAWNKNLILPIHPTASVAAQLALELKLEPVSQLSQLEPHYVRSAVPELAKK
jgi:tRNA threonylcarbamoyl adenosine modification protein YeaZ